MSIAANNRWAIYRRACDIAERDGSRFPSPPLEEDGLVDFTRLESRERIAYLDGWDHAARGVFRDHLGGPLEALFLLGQMECRRLNPKAINPLKVPA